jgi:Arc/MetJ family transcription regulator
MSVTQIDLDDDALAQAMRMLGTTTKKDTVNAALREVAGRGRRVAAAERLAAAYKRGEFDAGIRTYEARKAGQRAAARDLEVTTPPEDVA